MLRRPLARVALSLALALTLAAASAAPAAADPVADYERLLEWRFSARAIPVPAGGLALRSDSATWTLDSGTLRFQEPTQAGAVTGLVFEGRGRFHLDVPDPVERGQLARFTRRDAPAATFDAPFTRLVVRAPGGLAELAGESPPAGPYERSALAAEHHAGWLEHELFDVDARIVAALGEPGSDYFLAAADSDDHGWLVYELEPWSREEIELRHFRDGFSESWVSLDRAADRGPDGAPSRTRRDAIRVLHADVRADVTRPGKGARRGVTDIHPRIADLSVDVKTEATVSGPAALRLTLHPYAEVEAVRVDGAPAPFIRHHVGGRGMGIDSDLYDDDLLVILPAPLVAGEEHTVSADYELEILNYVSGRAWYPEEANSYLEDKHTGTFDLTLPERIELRAMGRRVGEPEIARGTRRERWTVEEPTFMLSFTFAERAATYDLAVEGMPPIEVFGPGMGKEAKFHNVGADVANSGAFFGQLFHMPLDAEKMIVSSIVGGHGQAFNGFLHVAEGSFYLERPGASELFRAHETAHQWWGHRVAWATYRDQWLSEAFAEYSAMMFVEATMEEGDKQMNDILDAYREALLGSIRGAFSSYARVGIVPLNDQQRERVGPIAVGYRASTADAPGGYTAQAYIRGPWVIHMLRVMLRNLTKSDDLFVKVLADFLHELDGRAAGTADFIATLTRIAPADWSWFFDQWVYGTAIPEYRWSWKAARGDDGGDVLELTVKQDRVPPGFRMPVPIAIDFGGGKNGQAVILVDKPEETFRIPLPARPRKVDFNPNNSVLAATKKM